MDYAAFCLPTQVWSASGPTRVPGDLPQPAMQTLRPRDADARRTAIGAAVFSNFPLGAFGAPPWSRRHRPGDAARGDVLVTDRRADPDARVSVPAGTLMEPHPRKTTYGKGGTLCRSFSYEPRARADKSGIHAADTPRGLGQSGGGPVSILCRHHPYKRVDEAEAKAAAWHSGVTLSWQTDLIVSMDPPSTPPRFGYCTRGFTNPRPATPRRPWLRRPASPSTPDTTPHTQSIFNGAKVRSSTATILAMAAAALVLITPFGVTASSHSTSTQAATTAQYDYEPSPPCTFDGPSC
jgi:hypothetical protein